ncbi:MAG: hypothetical protein JZU63_00285, partial [Rhodoferax sp.]|nr:hypothetical protein [Rhodoferax sp.]
LPPAAQANTVSLAPLLLRRVLLGSIVQTRPRRPHVQQEASVSKDTLLLPLALCVLLEPTGQ